ncbi:transposase InsO family protein [Bradyrhizobium sp. USDA 4472]
MSISTPTSASYLRLEGRAALLITSNRSVAEWGTVFADPVVATHDREVISWVATTAGISGEMIRDMMVHCVEQRFADIRAPRKVQWLTDNGSIFAAYRTLEIAAAATETSAYLKSSRSNPNGKGPALGSGGILSLTM